MIPVSVNSGVTKWEWLSKKSWNGSIYFQQICHIVQEINILAIFSVNRKVEKKRKRSNQLPQAVSIP